MRGGGGCMRGGGGSATTPLSQAPVAAHFATSQAPARPLKVPRGRRSGRGARFRRSERSRWMSARLVGRVVTVLALGLAGGGGPREGQKGAGGNGPAHK